jgi:eukaryotic-like serine/threonine-protein kinase
VTVAATLLGGRYCLDEQIGAGAFSEVWRATDIVLMRPVAVKLLHSSFAGEPEAQARFESEARHAAALSNENVARVYDYGGPACGQSYLVMELIEGPSLAGVLAGGPLDAARAMDIVAQVAAGLQAAHSAGLIHRDIKPANILFTSEGTARITDFGIAHAAGSAPLTETGMVIGTPGYLAPERIAGAAGDAASDLYALGIVAYECLAGVRPFSGQPIQVAMAHLERPLPPLAPSVPAEVVGFVMTLTAKDPAARPRSADEVSRQARRLQDRVVSGPVGVGRALGSSPLTVTDSPGGQIRDDARSGRHASRSRRPPALRAAAVAALAAVACLAMFAVTWLAPASNPGSHPSSAPQKRSATKLRPAATRPPGQQSSAGPKNHIGTAAAVGHADAQDLGLPPGQLRKTEPPSCRGLAVGHKDHSSAASKSKHKSC